MIASPKTKCSCCGSDNEPIYTLFRSKIHDLCCGCMRKYNPPSMTLVKFRQANYDRLWNLEVGVYEKFSNVEDLEWCGWFIRSRQQTVYRRVPKLEAVVFTLEYFGTVKCCRCVDYEYFDDLMDVCVCASCKDTARPKLPESKIEWPPQQSRLQTWDKAITDQESFAC